VDLPTLVSEPVVGDGRVYVTVGDGAAPTTDVEVHAFDAASGDTAWSASLLSLPHPVELFAATPVTFDGDRLWTGYSAISPSRGAAHWASSVLVDPETGRVTETGGDDLGLRDPVLDTGRHMVQVTGRLDPTRLRLSVRNKATPLDVEWERTVDSSTGHSSPIAVDGQVFWVVGNTLRAWPLDGCGARVCDPTWSQNVPGPSPTVLAAARGPHVYALTDLGLLAIDRATGAVLWRGTDLRGPATGAAVDGSNVYVSAAGEVRAYRTGGCGQQDCRSFWTGTFTSSVSGSPVVAGGVLYVGSHDAVTAFDLERCGRVPNCQIADIPVPGPVTSMSVAEGQLLVAHIEGLTAFAPTPPSPSTGSPSAASPSDD
jgi:outer membrane protein assembly factor BamB